MSSLFRFEPAGNFVEVPRDGLVYETGAVYPDEHLRSHFTPVEIDRDFKFAGNLPSDTVIVRCPRHLPTEVKDERYETDYADRSAAESALRRFLGFAR
jgi:hypothetical protein